MLRSREEYEALEQQMLSPRAALSRASKGRVRKEAPCDLRTCYQRDRDRIIHCNAFRRLKHKTQVFLAPEGDHYRTRLTHTLEVSQIARTIARALCLNEDLTEAISLGHDLGHTPFGHAGERVLNEVYSKGFHHYLQSVRVVDAIEKNGVGLNLTYEVKNGIACHTSGVEAETLEGRVVRIADKIAYINHDTDDAIRAGVLKNEDIPPEITRVLGERRSQRIDTLIRNVVQNSTDTIQMDKTVGDAFWLLHEFMYENVYKNPIAKGEEGKAMDVVRRLFFYFLDHPGELPPEYGFIMEREGTERAVCDYIAGMSDGYALQVYSNVFIPRAWDVMK